MKSSGIAPENLLEILFASVEDYAIFTVDKLGVITSWNRGAERVLGYRSDEIVGRNFNVLFQLADVANELPIHNLAVAIQAEYFEEEAWRVRKGGKRFWAHVKTTAIFEDGELVGFAKVIHDVTERLQASERFRLALESAPTGMVMIDRHGEIVLVNAQVERLFGYRRDVLIGSQIEMLVPERFRKAHHAHRALFVLDPAPRVMGFGNRELYGVHADGTEIPIEVALNPTSGGEFVLGSIVDVTQRKAAEREREHLMAQLRTLNSELEERVRARTGELAATLRERTVLLQEVHHRVKNNLQVISSMINMQLRQLEDPRSRDALEDCQTRVQAIALIHEKLYQSRDYARVPFDEYASSLAANVFHATGVSPDRISLDLAIDKLGLTVDKAIPLGLIMNELITNALKHAFPDGRRGAIKIAMGTSADGRVWLAVEDDGVGLPPRFDPQHPPSLGLQLVQTLVEQLEAELDVQSSRGTVVRITFGVEA